MQDKSQTLLDRLDESIALMAQLRTADPVSTAAFDALKQARALIARALAGEQQTRTEATTTEAAAA